MNATKFFSGLILFSIFTLNAGVTAQEKEKLGKRLLLCARWGSFDQVKECLDAGADINFSGDDYNETALHWAVSQGKVDVVKLLLARGADVNARDLEGNTPLLILVQQHLIKEAVCLQIMEILLSVKGIKVNHKNKLSETALFWAALKQRVSECELLLKYDSSTNIANDKWEYPMDVVCRDKKLKQKLQPTGLYRFIHWLKE